MFKNARAQGERLDFIKCLDYSFGVNLEMRDWRNRL